MESLGRLEFQILATLLDHPRDAYGVTIKKRVASRSGQMRSLAAIYTALDRLQAKGLVSSWWGEPTAERGGRRKRYYKIEAAGQRAVRAEQRAVLGVGRMAAQGG